MKIQVLQVYERTPRTNALNEIQSFNYSISMQFFKTSCPNFTPAGTFFAVLMAWIINSMNNNNLDWKIFIHLMCIPTGITVNSIALYLLVTALGC